MLLRLGLLLLCIGGICCIPDKRVIMNAFGGSKGIERGAGAIDDDFKGTDLTHTGLPSSSQVEILGRRRRAVSSSSEENDDSMRCFVTSELADPMTKVFQRLVNTFTQKVDSVTAFEDATELETTLGSETDCGIAVSRIKTSAWFILNRVWLATSCQYPDEKAFKAAHRETFNEIRNVDRVWKAFEIPEDVGCLYEHCTSQYPAVMRSAFKEAVYKMEHVHNTGMCKVVDVKQVTDTLEAAVGEIKTIRKALEIQGSTTNMALAALAAQKEETEDVLRAFGVLKSETQIALTRMESSNTGLKKLVEDSITKLEAEKTCCKISGRVGNNTAHEELRDKEENLSNSEAMVQLLHDLSSNERGVPSWASGIQAGRIDEIVKVANLPYVSMILMGHMERLVAKAYSSNPGNIAAVIKFVEEIADKRLKLEAYKALFAVVDHNKDVKESVRLIYKLVESWKKYNGSELSIGPSFQSFLHEHVHPGLIKLISSEYFNLACGHDNGWYLYLYSNPDPVSVVQNGAISNSPQSSERKVGDKWIWQFLPAPGNHGSAFYLRNKLNSGKSFPSNSTASINDNFVQIEPVVAETPVARLVKSDFTFSSNIKFRMRSVKHYSQYYSEGPHLSLGSYGNKVEVGDGQISIWIPSFL